MHKRGIMIALVLAVGAIGAGWIVSRGNRTEDTPKDLARTNEPGDAETSEASERSDANAWSANIQPPIDEGVPGRWHHVTTEEENLTPEQLAAIDKLRSIGYVAGSRQAPKRMGVVLNELAITSAGLNLYTSGHAPSAVLMEMDGKIIHEWSYAFEQAWPVNNVPDGTPGKDYWRRVHLFGNGDLLAIFEGLAMIKIDHDSKLIWKYPGFCHHDLDVTEDGSVYVLTRKFGVIERIHPTEPVIEDFLTVLSADGRPLREISLLSAFENSSYAHLLERTPPAGDIFHTNTVVVLQGLLADKSPAFAAGNVLISVLNMDAIAVLDMASESIVWATTGPWRRQHDPLPLADGNMLLFDNLGGNGFSNVYEFDPTSMKVSWAFRGNTDNRFFSASCGSVQRLSNGNTLITESDGGRAFSVTQDGHIAWKFISPHRAGEHDELIATLFELIRLPPDFPIDWAHDAG